MLGALALEFSAIVAPFDAPVPGWWVMDTQTAMTVFVMAGGRVVVVWVLQKIGKAIAAILEALAALAMVALALWLVVRFAWWLVRTAVTYRRTRSRSSGGLAALVGLVVTGDHGWIRGTPRRPRLARRCGS